MQFTVPPTDLRFPAPDGTVLQIRAALLCVRDGALLTCHDERFPDILFVPGGAVQTGETAAMAARREWLEETGEVAEDLQLCGVMENLFELGGQACQEYGFYFRVALCGPAPACALDNPRVALRWVPLPDLRTSPLRPAGLPGLLNVPAGAVRHFVNDDRPCGAF
ncbi:MAG: NUDIX domain-containing protein [Deinococcus sp.]|nr:NUDIX domain-containing protein [Deinococcus sp.]